MQRRFHELITDKIRAADGQVSELVAFAAQLRAAAGQLSGEPIDGPCGANCACLTADVDAAGRERSPVAVGPKTNETAESRSPAPSTPAPHPPEFRRRAVELARERTVPVMQLDRELGVSESCLRNWMARADIDEGRREGLTTGADVNRDSRAALGQGRRPASRPLGGQVRWLGRGCRQAPGISGNAWLRSGSRRHRPRRRHVRVRQSENALYVSCEGIRKSAGSDATERDHRTTRSARTRRVSSGGLALAGGWAAMIGTVERSWVADALSRSRVARLGTVDAQGAVRLVPICFVVVDGWVAGAVDHKPKRSGQLRRLDDIEATGQATVLVDHYDEDWSQLWWLRIRGRAVVHRERDDVTIAVVAALGAKYSQYAECPPAGAIYRIALDEVRSWRAHGP